jgi:hypothetical protein
VKLALDIDAWAGRPGKRVAVSGDPLQVECDRPAHLALDLLERVTCRRATRAYRFVVAPPSGRRWPPLPARNARSAARRSHGERSRTGSGRLPPLRERSWDTVTRYRRVRLADVRSGEAWALTEALLTLHSTADEACADVAVSGRKAPDTSFDGRAWRLLAAHGSGSRLPPTRVRIVPKTQLSQRGITIRSLSRHLALCYESVDVRWRSFEPALPKGPRSLQIVLMPWPLSVSACDFRAVSAAPLGEESGGVDAVIFPEAAVRPGEISRLEDTLAKHGASLLISGVREPPAAGTFGRNYLHLGVRTASGWDRHEQDKHHRWCLDGRQIRQYHLTRSLDPKRLWWEGVDILERTLHLVEIGGGVTAAPLVCEDLARLDEVADLVRRIGPSLVVALLLDGPQLSSRWPSRYASVLADDPGRQS